MTRGIDTINPSRVSHKINMLLMCMETDPKNRDDRRAPRQARRPSTAPQRRRAAATSANCAERSV